MTRDFDGTARTYNIYGLAAADAGWDNSQASWNDINGAGAGDWSGGTLGGSVITATSYGTFSTTGTGGTDAPISLDITSAFKAYLDGTISGIAFADFNNDGISPSNFRFNVYSDDNGTASLRPGLQVQVIPEPSAALLGGLDPCLLQRPHLVLSGSSGLRALGR